MLRCLKILMQTTHHTTLRGCSTCRLMWWAPCAIIQIPRMRMASTPDTPRMSLPTMNAPKAATIVIVISVCITATEGCHKMSKLEQGAWHAMMMLSSHVMAAWCSVLWRQKAMTGQTSCLSRGSQSNCQGATRQDVRR